MRHIATRFALILAGAALLPLGIFGIVSILSLRAGTRESIVAGNLNVAARATEAIRGYVSSHSDMLKALAADLQNTGLNRSQQDRILKNWILEVPRFREITLFDEARNPIVSSRVGPPRIVVPTDATVNMDGVSMSPIRVDDDLLPTTVFAVPLTRLGQPAG